MKLYSEDTRGGPWLATQRFSIVVLHLPVMSLDATPPLMLVVAFDNNHVTARRPASRFLNALVLLRKKTSLELVDRSET